MGKGETIRAVLAHKGGAIFAVAPESSVYEALETMAEHDIGALLVISDSLLCGVFSERDYARKVILLGKSSRETNVGEIMSSPALTVEPEETVEHAMEAMIRHHIRYLPVAHDDNLLGIVSIGDLVNWTIKRQEEEIQHLSHYIAGEYPG